MIRKAVVALAAVALATVASFSLGAVAGAQYAPAVCTVTVSPTSVAPGAAVTLSGSLIDSEATKGPIAGQTIVFSVNGLELGSATTDADGNFSTQVNIPVDLAPGSYMIEANCGTGPDGEILGNTDVVVTGTTPTTPTDPGGNGGNNGTNGGTNGGNGGSYGGSSGNQSGGTLARTGTDLGLPVQIGVALLALGGIALALSASRRRRGATA